MVVEERSFQRSAVSAAKDTFVGDSDRSLDHFLLILYDGSRERFLDKFRRGG